VLAEIRAKLEVVPAGIEAQSTPSHSRTNDLLTVGRRHRRARHGGNPPMQSEILVGLRGRLKEIPSGKS
jgi:hypothetical protein